MVEIPLLQIPNQELNIELNEQSCTLQIRQMGDYVYLSLTVDQTVIRNNAICMVGMPILYGCEDKFNGNFYLVDASAPADLQEQPNYEEFSDRFKLLYLTADEVASDD